MPSCLVFGDSNTHGSLPMAGMQGAARLPRADRWPSVMEATLGSAWDVVADGLPGRTTVHEDPVGGGHRNGLAMLGSALGAHGPVDVLVIMLGTNDLKARFNLSAEEIARSVGLLVQFAQRSGLAQGILAITPPLVLERGCLAGDFRGAEARGANLPTAMSEMAELEGCAHFDANGEIAVSDLDGVHFDAATHKKLGRVVAAKITSMTEMT
ncbi:MAG: GDSL-type esterase/lipase family protein [Pseudomonadota bacterium]